MDEITKESVEDLLSYDIILRDKVDYVIRNALKRSYEFTDKEKNDLHDIMNDLSAILLAE